MKKLFGTDGIRARAGHWPLTGEFIERLGQVAGAYLKKRAPSLKPQLLLARDTRESSRGIEISLASGLRRSRVAVVSGGVLPTSAVAALVPRRRWLGGAVISASHNPAEFNGIKFFSFRGEKWPDTWEADIESLLENDAPPRSRFSGGASLRKESFQKDYLDFLKNSVPRGFSLKGMRVVLDTANGSATEAAPELFKSLGAEVKTIHAAPDGKNINASCGALHPQALQKSVESARAHFGVAFDGDADRAIFVDERGRVCHGDHTLTVLARFLKLRNELTNNMVVSTVMANWGFRVAMRHLDVKFKEVSVGDKYVAEALKTSGALLGGEQSGHIIFKKFLATGDGLLTALQMARVLVETERPLSALSSLMVEYPQVLLNVPMEKKMPLEDIPEFLKTTRRLEEKWKGRGRLLIRYSGTEPLLRVMIEGTDAAEIYRDARQLAALAEGVSRSKRP